MKRFIIIIKPPLLAGVIVFFFLLLSIISYAAEKEEDQVKRNADSYINDGAEFLGSTIETSKTIIINRLGKPKSIKSEIVKNHHDDSMDTIYELYYRGLLIELYEVRSDNRSFIFHIILENKKYKTKWGLNVGSTREKIIKVLGEPGESTNTLLTFMFSEAYPNDTVKFYLKHNIVHKIEWKYTVD